MGTPRDFNTFRGDLLAHRVPEHSGWEYADRLAAGYRPLLNMQSEWAVARP